MFFELAGTNTIVQAASYHTALFISLQL